MNNRQDRLCRAAESSVACARRLRSAHPRVAAAADRLEAAVRVARAASVKQQSAKAARGLPQNSTERAKKILFHKHLVPIAADTVGLLAGTDDFESIEADLELPRLKDPPEDLLRAAQRVRRVVSRYEQHYIDRRDYAPDFVEQFDKAASDLRQAAAGDRGAAGRAHYTAATREVQEAVDEVQRCFDSLDARMMETCFDDEALLRDWRKSSRIPGKVGRPKKRKGRQKPSDDAGSDETSPEGDEGSG
jgi:hypothetical protein